MKIAVCEDQKEEAEWLCEVIRQWCTHQELPFDVVSFADAASFSFRLEDTVYDALFLDIKMPGEDGVALAKRLRERAEDIPIVFVTGEREYIMEGYEVEAVHYLLKPVQKEKIWECLDRIYLKMKTPEPYIILQTEGATVKLLQKDIYKIEVYAHKLVYTTEKGEYVVASSLKEAQKELQEGWFISCHRGVLVNLWHVVSIGKSSLILENDGMDFSVEVPVSRRLYQQVNEAFVAFYKE